jgi:hypothetical protein
MFALKVTLYVIICLRSFPFFYYISIQALRINFIIFSILYTWTMPCVTDKLTIINVIRNSDRTTRYGYTSNFTMIGKLQPGWPDWVNFRQLGDCLLWAVFAKNDRITEDQIIGLLFPVHLSRHLDLTISPLLCTS